jgi:methyltransferase
MLALVIASQALRWWCIRTLGPRWNTRIVVVPGWPLVHRGPYRVLPHPNYVAVVLEGAALPLVHTAWVTALVFTVLNLPLLAVRIRAEEAAMAAAVVQPATGAR